MSKSPFFPFDPNSSIVDRVIVTNTKPTTKVQYYYCVPWTSNLPHSPFNSCLLLGNIFSEALLLRKRDCRGHTSVDRQATVHRPPPATRRESFYTESPPLAAQAPLPNLSPGRNDQERGSTRLPFLADVWCSAGQTCAPPQSSICLEHLSGTDKCVAATIVPHWEWQPARYHNGLHYSVWCQVSYQVR